VTSSLSFIKAIRVSRLKATDSMNHPSDVVRTGARGRVAAILKVVVLAAACGVGCDRVPKGEALGPLEAGPAQKLMLAPPTEVLQPDPDLRVKFEAAAARRLEERRRETFIHPSTVAAVRGTVTAAEPQLFETKDLADPWLIATRYQIRRQRAWKKALPPVVEVWVVGGENPAYFRVPAAGRSQSDSNEVYLSVGQEVILSLREAPLFPGDANRVRVFRGRSGTLLSAKGSDRDTPALDAFARYLDERLPGS